MEIKDWDAVGHHIARVRKLRRWTQKELADKLNVNASMVSRWEKGQIYPKEAQIEQIAEALKVKTDELNLPKSASVAPLVSMGKDLELLALLEQISALDEGDKQALKAVVQAMIIKSHVRDAMGAAHLAGRAS